METLHANAEVLNKIRNAGSVGFDELHEALVDSTMAMLPLMNVDRDFHVQNGGSIALLMVNIFSKNEIFPI